jgi:hypothetical protein
MPLLNRTELLNALIKVPQQQAVMRFVDGLGLWNEAKIIGDGSGANPRDASTTDTVAFHDIPGLSATLDRMTDYEIDSTLLLYPSTGGDTNGMQIQLVFTGGGTPMLNTVLTATFSTNALITEPLYTLSSPQLVAQINDYGIAFCRGRFTTDTGGGNLKWQFKKNTSGTAVILAGSNLRLRPLTPS